jgi:hypothetical protein
VIRSGLNRPLAISARGLPVFVGGWPVSAFLVAYAGRKTGCPPPFAVSRRVGHLGWRCGPATMPFSPLTFTSSKSCDSVMASASARMSAASTRGMTTAAARRTVRTAAITSAGATVAAGRPRLRDGLPHVELRT